MGRWFAGFLSQDGFDVMVSDKDICSLSPLADEFRIQISDNIKVAQESDAILISVSIDKFEEVIKEIAPYVRSNQVVADVTSVKEYPVKIMHQHLEKTTVLGAHPLFGPGAKDLTSQNFVLTPTCDTENSLAREVTAYLQDHGARVTLMTPKKHDEMMSVVLGLAHFISIAAADTLIEIGNLQEFKAVGGSTYRVLTTLVESVVSEDPVLYATLQMHLPRAQAVETLFQDRVAKWLDMVKREDKEGFISNMNILKNKFKAENTNFGQAYDIMYKIMEWL